VLYKLHGLKMNFYKNNFNLEDYSEFNELDDNNVFEDLKLNKNFLNKYYIKHISEEETESQFNNKNIDIKYKSFSLFKKNREILNNLLIKKNLKQYKFNKIIKNFIKKPAYNAIQRYEFKLINMLIRTNFFTNFKDATFFIKNGYVLINGDVVKNVNHLLNLNDVVRISYNKYYFLYYRKGLHNLINNISKYNSYL
jgi:ribosomal protein S4